jgi:hypothetical protein
MWCSKCEKAQQAEYTTAELRVLVEAVSGVTEPA